MTDVLEVSPVNTEEYRLLHTMIRVADIDHSIEFYTKQLGMHVIRKKEFEGGRFTNVFIGYGDEKNSTVIELTYNWDQQENYSHGSGFGHIALGVPDIYSTCDTLKKNNIKIVRPPGPMKHGNTVIAFIEDPDGYKIELIET